MADGAQTVPSDSEIQPNEIQRFGALTNVPIGLNDNARTQSVAALNQILVDTMALRDLYKKHHWQVSGVTFYQLHLLLDKHYDEQAALVDTVAERIMSLGGLSYATAQDVVAHTQLKFPPAGREDVATQIARLLDAHRIILATCRQAARDAADAGDDGTNDLIVGALIRLHEMQVWFLAEHQASTPLLAKDR
jgi:starvation-inducible DNA-binding protein